MVSFNVKKEPIEVDLDSEAEDEKSPLLSPKAEDSSHTASEDEHEHEGDEDSRFHQPTPSPFKRLSLVLLLVFLFWAGFQLRAGLLEGKKKPKIIYASRYSKEHKFRPAASPIITETLKDGRVRLRGAVPPSATPTPTTKPKTVRKKKKPTTGSVSGQRKSTRAKHKPAAGKRF